MWFNSSESGWFLRGKLWPAKARLLQDRLCHTHKHMYAHTCITSSQTRGTVSALVERSHLYDWICILFLAILYLYNGFKSMHTAQIPLVYWLTSSSKALIYSQGGGGKNEPRIIRKYASMEKSTSKIYRNIFLLHNAVINSKSRGNRLKFFWDML